MGRILALATFLLCWTGQRWTVSAQGIDPNLRVDIAKGNQSVILSWFGSNAVPYQVESSSALTTWTNSGLAVTGRAAPLFFTNSIAGQSRSFYRVKRLPTPEVMLANFISGILIISGDEHDNTIVISRNASGAILLNGGAIAIRGGVPTVANTVLIQAFGGPGNDQISLDESNGALPRAQLFGEAGNDTLTGGSGDDLINGGPGADILLGRGGADTLIGGDDNDVVTGGDGNDVILLGAGDDRFVWNPGDDTDVIDGGDGNDTVEVNGGNGAEDFTTTANGTRVRFDRVNPAPFSLDIGTCENLVLNANGGNDTFAAAGNLAALIRITVDGGAGDDTLRGSNGNDVLIGGDGKDVVEGGQGNDVILLGAGDDVVVWNPGDGNDTVEGQAGNDTLRFNGSNVGERVELSANGARLRFSRDVANIALDLGGIETVEYNALGGADTITVDDLSGTELSFLNLHLAGVAGTTTGDAQVDTVVLQGTPGSDNIVVAQVAEEVTISGLKASVSITGAEVADLLIVHSLGGNDTLNASGLTSLFTVTLDGGPGADTLIGSPRADLLIGGDDNDTITGRQGNDTLLGGDGSDTFVWNPGDGSDVLEGQAGVDKLVFNVSNISENLDLSANGARVRLFRDVANVVMDLDDVEKIELNSLGGADTITVNDLTGTDLTNVALDLAATGGGGDGQPDQVILNGTSADDTVVVDGVPGKIAVTGLAASLTITGSEAALDRLTVNALAGADRLDASRLAANVINLTLNGGSGEDLILGSQGADTISGGPGIDVAFGGGGNDLFLWNPGDGSDTVEGQAGTDTLQVNGANVGESIDLSANGSRLRFFRNVANVVLDCAGVEQVQYSALGGADTIVVNNLSGTGVTSVSLGLSGVLGGVTGDNQADSVVLNGTPVDDAVVVSGSASGVTVSGLSAAVTITGSEGANDRLTVNTLAGDDAVDASGLVAGIIGYTADGGIGGDVLIGSAGADILLGGDGDDVLIGGAGLDVLDGGSGANVVIQ